MARQTPPALDAGSLIRHLASLFELPPESPDLFERLLDRVGNLRHQTRHLPLLDHCLRKNRALIQQNRQLQHALRQQAPAGNESVHAHPLQLIFTRCIEQINEEYQKKQDVVDAPAHAGFWRHDWFELAHTYGAGYLYAQAMHELRQAQGMPYRCATERRLDAINHVAMGLLHEQRIRPAASPVPDS